MRRYDTPMPLRYPEPHIHWVGGSWPSFTFFYPIHIWNIQKIKKNKWWMDDDGFVSESTRVHGQVWDIVTSCGKPKVENCAWYLIRTSGFINSPCEYRSQETLACDWICSFWGTMRWGCSYGWGMGCWCLTCGFTNFFAEYMPHFDAFWRIYQCLPHEMILSIISKNILSRFLKLYIYA